MRTTLLWATISLSATPAFAQVDEVTTPPPNLGGFLYSLAYQI
jgi:hypothetical protein